MTALDALWHLLNALAAPFGLSFLTVGMGWLGNWPRGVRHSVGGHLLAVYATCAAAYLGVWAWTGTEGTMLGYALMVVAAALALWLRTLRPR